MPDNVELRANFTADSKQLSDALEKSKTQIEAVKKASEQTTGGLGKMAEASKQSALGAEGLSSGMSKLQQALGKVSPEMANFTRLLDPKILAGGVSGLGGVTAAFGALLLVIDQTNKTIDASLTKHLEKIDTLIDRAEKANSLAKSMDTGKSRLIDEIIALDQKQNKSVEELAKLQAKVKTARDLGLDINMDTTGKVYGAQEAKDQEAYNSYIREKKFNDEQYRLTQDKINAEEAHIAKLESYRDLAQPAFSMIPLGQNLSDWVYGGRIKKAQEALEKSQAEQQKLEAERQELALLPGASVEYERQYRRYWQQQQRQQQAAQQQQQQAEEEPAAGDEHAALIAQRLTRYRNGAADTPGWFGTTISADQADQMIHYLQQMAQDTLHVAKEE